MNVSPVIIEVMLKAYYCADFCARPHPRSHFEAIQTLAQQGLVVLTEPGVDDEDEDEDEDELVKTTPKGEAWVKMLLATPFPVQELRFLDPRNKALV